MHCGCGNPSWGVENVNDGVFTSMPATIPEAPSSSPLLAAAAEETELEALDRDEDGSGPALLWEELRVMVVVVTAALSPCNGAGACVAPEISPPPDDFSLPARPRDKV